MTNSKATRVISEIPTEWGFVIRKEFWGGMSAQVEVLSVGSGDGKAEEFAEALQGQIEETEEMEMVTCYTDKGYWIGNLDMAIFLCRDKKIAPEPQEGVDVGVLRPCNIGWCEEDQQWFGWSHRALCGFGVGAEVKKGDCAFIPTDLESARAAAIQFWEQDGYIDVQAELETDEDGVQYFEITWTYCNDKKLIPNEALHGTKGSTNHYPPAKFGKGEWTAKTLTDAKQMARDFAASVS